MAELKPEERENNLRKFALRLALALAFLTALPALVAYAAAPDNGLYLGAQFNTDDHMVYAAWIHQAYEGRILFDNRFAVDPQPGLTIHLFFLLLGNIARIFGFLGPEASIPLVANLARVGFTVLFVLLLAQFAGRFNFSLFATKLGLAFATCGAGLGFLVWEPFGRLTDAQNPVAAILEQRLPIDVWQPEAFLFPSMLTNALFMVSLCLIVIAFDAVLRAENSWKPVPGGALAMFVLMNIHSYDVLLIALVLVAFLVATLAQKQASPLWIARAAVIGAGAIPAAAWFLYVLANDPVFQARAATLTYSPTFRQVLLGVLPFVILSLLAVHFRFQDHRRLAAPVAIAVLLFGLALGSTGYDPDQGYYLSWPAWLVAFTLAAAIAAYASDKPHAWNFLLAWALVALVAPYIPQLFQRKLAMALVIPWAFLAALGLEWLLARLHQGRTGQDARSVRNLVSYLALAVVSASSLFWLQREFLLIRNNVASTTVQNVYLTADATNIIRYLNRQTGRIVVIARPGIPLSNPANPFTPPYLPDLNPILSGLAGAYTFAGHWSETPDYNQRRQTAEALFRAADPEQIRQILRDTQADYVVVPNPDSFPEIPTADLRPFGQTTYDGRQFSLIRINKAAL